MSLSTILKSVALSVGLISGSSHAQQSFTPTGQQTARGYGLFEYQGNQKPNTVRQKQEISDRFNSWDEQQGDACRNTGWKNVRVHNGKAHVAAVCTSPQRPSFSDRNYQKINYRNPKVQEGIQEGKFEPGFLSDLEKMCKRLDMHCMGLISIIDYETGGSFRPDIKNPNGSASGLIQFTRETARSLGTSTSALRKMKQRKQLQYVEQYFRLMQKLRLEADYSNPLDLALTIFQPSAVGKGSNHIIARQGSRAYRQNRGLDRSPADGKITASEYTRNALNRGYF